ncbi:2,5-diamino-6-(ribosylamino)-4(3H)-pyrimidinone 5'-phosphate reductase [Candidatus Bathycorpusculum sp.]|uniref:2,5-diamino-6-(ribosylamino)-4(3H)-pyrimidinone 5'-phosphate reductase n=1 Tax=Candidatus Bathycorpusculum sp. TaxID=2994959 RepID=UPI0028225360|nr:2,5-diamino-6-(ribosylamino)-4(3H)-pyrimidinone 5'-phosphate reductase [Candidatus Termitimicrobium sp.]MCL2684935.1 2,5-diamino-6-(ribosylamino)-4(3H)-pyrimidinone 5'-phosphate reductase [Candidatus Termitimicrobium sp.]
MQGVEVIVGGFMSIDGKIAPANRNGQEFTQLMTPLHKKMLHSIRASVDAVVVGVGTVLADDPTLTVRDVEGKNPLRVVLDSKAQTPLTAKIANTNQASTLIATTTQASKEKIKALKNKNIEVFISNSEKTVNLQELVEALKSRGVRKVLVEGGAEVRWSFFEANLVDELFVWIMPYVWGGKEAPTLVDGQGFLGAQEAKKLKLKSTEHIEGLTVLWFTVQH